MGSVFRSFVRVGLGAALAMALAGCGRDSPVPPTVVITPQPVRGVIANPPALPDFQSDVWFSIPIEFSQSGVLDITVDWTFPDTWMYVYFGKTDCDYARLADHTCPFLIKSETQTPKPRVLYTDMLEGGKYYLYLYNVPRNPRNGTGSDNTERVSVQIGLTVFPSGRRSTNPVHLGRPIVVSPPRL
jgi:hypothetical protein